MGNGKYLPKLGSTGGNQDIGKGLAQSRVVPSSSLDRADGQRLSKYGMHQNK
jgi:hypothetical protein